MVDNIEKAGLISYRFVDPDQPAEEITDIGDRTRVEIMAEMELTWRDEYFNTPTGRTIRFAVMEKLHNGWKLIGLGTGP